MPAGWWSRRPSRHEKARQNRRAKDLKLASAGAFAYSLRSASSHSKLLLILPLVVAIAFALITDIDTPRHGLIRVVPQNLNALLASFGPR